MTRPPEEWTSTEIFEYSRDPRPLNGDGRSVDGVPMRRIVLDVAPEPTMPADARRRTQARLWPFLTPIIGLAVIAALVWWIA